MPESVRRSGVRSTDRGTVPTYQNQSPPNPSPPAQQPEPTGQKLAGPDVAPIREHLRLFLILLLGLVVVSQLALPFRLAGLLLGLAAGWVGIRLLIAMLARSRAGSSVRGWPSVVIGLGLTVVLTLVLTVQAIFYPVMAERERCMAGANTLKAKDNCDQAYQDRLDDLTDNLRRRTGQSP
jgi:hypothetical protein